MLYIATNCSTTAYLPPMALNTVSRTLLDSMNTQLQHDGIHMAANHKYLQNFGVSDMYYFFT